MNEFFLWRFKENKNFVAYDFNGAKSYIVLINMTLSYVSSPNIGQVFSLLGNLMLKLSRMQNTISCFMIYVCYLNAHANIYLSVCYSHLAISREWIETTRNINSNPISIKCERKSFLRFGCKHHVDMFQYYVHDCNWSYKKEIFSLEETITIN